MNIRPATFSDIEEMLALKSQLRFTEQDGTSTKGGFLLGTDAAGYRNRIAQQLTWVIDDNGIKGFSIVLPDQALRASEIWSRRHQIEWTIDPTHIETSTLGYYDQLAVLPGPWRSFVPILTIVNVLDFLKTKPNYLISSTVRKPVTNLAAVPYLKILGGQQVGIIDEFDSSIGQLVSDIWLISLKDMEAFLYTNPSKKIATFVDNAKNILKKHKE